jgi:hypothetical protein
MILQIAMSLKNPPVTVGQPSSTAIGMPNLRSLKAKRLGKLPQEKVLLSTKTKILLYVKILPSLLDLQPNLFTTLLAKKDMLTNAIHSRFKPRNSQLAS